MNYSERLNHVIPGGAHTYSRGDDQFPLNSPQIIAKGEGAYVRDAFGNKFLDYGMGLRAVTLGYANKEVNEAAIREIWNGNNLTRASLIELQAAETITSLIPGAEMVKFAKNGSTVTSAAVKLARAYTGRSYIARCLEQPFFSYDDWFIGDTVIKKGIPKEFSDLTLHFNYNNIDSLIDLFAKYPGQIAGVILEPASVAHPENNFLHKVKEVCKKNGSLFILDEMISGFRWHNQGAQKYYNIEPDLSTFGKGMANGFSVSALVGKREIMEMGSIKTIGKERVFLISTTHGAEMCGLGAFVKTVEIYKNIPVVDHLWDYGNKLISGMNAIAKDLGIENYFETKGVACSPYYITKDKKGEISLAFRTLFSQEMIENGVLMPWIALSYSHGDAELEKTLNATRKALKKYALALDEGCEKYLRGPAVKPVFRTHN